MIEHADKIFESLKKEASDAFEKEFGVTPFLLASAPSRVNLIGEHIDYCDGFVLPMAINRHVVIAAAPNGMSQANVVSTLYPDKPATVVLDEPPVGGVPRWANYIRGVADGFRLKDLWPVPGFDAVVHSNIPLNYQGLGLGNF